MTTSLSIQRVINIKFLLRLAACAIALGFFGSAYSGVLPEDRFDALYHRYDGGGVVVGGEAFLVRKKIGENLDVNGTYDIDMTSSASLDVMTAASPYKEKRKQYSLGLQYLHGKTTYGITGLKSSEPDYLSNNISYSIKEDMFGDLTTVTLGFTRGRDHVRQHIVDKATRTDTFNDKFLEYGNIVSPRLDRRAYRVGVTQILTRKLITTFNYESQALEGFLRNPYRRVRYGDVNSTSISYQNEIYPHTRTSNALGLEGRYYLNYRASLKLAYRYYTDTWGIMSSTGEIEYVHPFGEKWISEWSVRYYSQKKASFYSDIFPYVDAQNFLARDRELSTMNDMSFHFGIERKWKFTQKVYIKGSFFYDRIQYNYKDFRDNLNSKLAPANQPLYKYGSNVFMLQATLGF